MHVLLYLSLNKMAYKNIIYGVQKWGITYEKI